MERTKVGVWLVGSRGSVATTVALGLAALQRELIEPVGLVSALPDFSHLDLAAWDDLVLGGHEVRTVRLADEAERMRRESQMFDSELLDACRGSLDAWDANMRYGTLFNVGTTIEQLASDGAGQRMDTPSDTDSPREIVERLQQDLVSFATDHGLSRVVVLNLASTEPAVDTDSLPTCWEALEKTLDDRDSCPLRASSLYAIAALELGHAYINFTPSLGATAEAINELACQRATCHAGYDGKTGETLMKSVLAPMFSHRNLPVMSWVGHNIFGNLDGRVLNDPANKSSKVTSKDRLLRDILGYEPKTLVSIEYIESLGDWKTAWDHIHFRGFLNTPMTLQFTWQGCDSMLAAPLVMDLVRLVDLSRRKGDTGALGFLASFFQSSTWGVGSFV